MPLDPGRALPHGAAAPVLAIAADLMFASRIRAAATAAGVDAELVRSPDALLTTARERKPRRIFIDLDARAFDPAALIRQLKEGEHTRQFEVIAFVSHVREDAIAAARAAGADRVLARSAFMRELPALIVKP